MRKPRRPAGRFGIVRSLLGAVALSLLAVGSVTAANLAISYPDPEATILHRASGFVFPKALADMPRRKLVVYAEDDLSVQYTDRGGGNGDPTMDLYVYPAQRSFEDEWRSIEAAIAQGSAVVSSADPFPAPARAVDNHMRWYLGQLQGRGSLWTTGYVLVERRGWFIEARVSIPRESGERGVDQVRKALDAIDWDGVRNVRAEKLTLAPLGRHRQERRGPMHDMPAAA